MPRLVPPINLRRHARISLQFHLIRLSMMTTHVARDNRLAVVLSQIGDSAIFHVIVFPIHFS